MPEFLGLDKAQWKWVGIAGVGAVGLYLLMHRSSGSSGGDSGLPATGPIPGQAPAGNLVGPHWFAPAEQAAANAASRMGFREKAQQRAAGNLQATIAAQTPEINVNTGRTKLFGPGTDIAQQGGTKERHGGLTAVGDWFSRLGTELSRGATEIVSGLTAIRTGGQSLAQSNPLVNYGRPTGPAPAALPGLPQFTPGIIAPNQGGSPAPAAPSYNPLTNTNDAYDLYQSTGVIL